MYVYWSMHCQKKLNASETYMTLLSTQCHYSDETIAHYTLCTLGSATLPARWFLCIIIKHERQMLHLKSGCSSSLAVPRKDREHVWWRRSVVEVLDIDHLYIQLLRLVQHAASAINSSRPNYSAGNACATLEGNGCADDESWLEEHCELLVAQPSNIIEGQVSEGSSIFLEGRQESLVSSFFAESVSTTTQKGTRSPSFLNR